MITRLSSRKVAIALTRVSHVLRQTLFVVRETAAGQHNRAGVDLNIALIASEDRAGHAIFVFK